jgi:hypothetical protein
MSDEPLTNAAVDWESAHFGRMNRLDSALIGDSYPITADFEYDDRRTGGLNFGPLDRSSFVEAIKSNWDFGARRPIFSILEVVSVRGERSAAIMERVDFGNDMYVDFLGVFQLDCALQLQHRYVTFSPDARDEAIAELDRMHAEIDD